MTVELNPDGVSVKGCHFIYPPRGQAGEYSALAANPYRGCGHKCAYCYVPLITKQDRAEFNAGAIVRDSYLDKLRKDARKYRAAGVTEQVMISFTSDPYHPGPGEANITRECFEMMQEHGLAVCALTKGGTRALQDIDIFRPKRDAFASTLTSLDDAFSLKWESGAALPADRLKALRAFHDRGIFTWVSLEPTLSIEHSLAIVDATHEFIDLYKVGRANYVPTITGKTDWRDYTLRMIEKLKRLGNAHYIKKDLQGYLPPNYHNPLRVPQHH